MSVPPVQPARQISAPASGAVSGSPVVPPAPENKKGKFGKPSLKGSKKEKAEKTKSVKESAAVEEDGFDPEKAKKKFLLPQAVIMVALAALVSFGAFTDEYGDIAVTNILAVVLILAVTEVILYREAYVNSRSKGNKKMDKKADKKVVQKNSGKKPAGPGMLGLLRLNLKKKRLKNQRLRSQRRKSQSLQRLSPLKRQRHQKRSLK